LDNNWLVSVRCLRIRHGCCSVHLFAWAPAAREESRIADAAGSRCFQRVTVARWFLPHVALVKISNPVQGWSRGNCKCHRGHGWRWSSGQFHPYRITGVCPKIHVWSGVGPGKNKAPLLSSSVELMFAGLPVCEPSPCKDRCRVQCRSEEDGPVWLGAGLAGQTAGTSRIQRGIGKCRGRFVPTKSSRRIAHKRGADTASGFTAITPLRPPRLRRLHGLIRRGASSASIQAQRPLLRLMPMLAPTAECCRFAAQSAS